MDAIAKGNFVKEIVISGVEAPRLRGTSTRHFIDFKSLSNSCEKQIKNEKQLKKELIPTA